MKFLLWFSCETPLEVLWPIFTRSQTHLLAVVESICLVDFPAETLSEILSALTITHCWHSSVHPQVVFGCFQLLSLIHGGNFSVEFQSQLNVRQLKLQDNLHISVFVLSPSCLSLKLHTALLTDADLEISSVTACWHFHFCCVDSQQVNLSTLHTPEPLHLFHRDSGQTFHYSVSDDSLFILLKFV